MTIIVYRLCDQRTTIFSKKELLPAECLKFSPSINLGCYGIKDTLTFTSRNAGSRFHLMAYVQSHQWILPCSCLLLSPAHGSDKIVTRGDGLLRLISVGLRYKSSKKIAPEPSWRTVPYALYSARTFRSSDIWRQECALRR